MKIFILTSCTLAMILLINHTAFAQRSDSRVKVSAVAGKLGADGKQVVTVTFMIDKTWHIYANPVKEETLETARTEIKVFAAGKPVKAEVKYPAGRLYKDKDNPKLTCMVYENKVDIQVIVQRAAGDTGPLQVETTFNACDDKNCLLPSTKRIPVK